MAVITILRIFIKDKRASKSWRVDLIISVERAIYVRLQRFLWRARENLEVRNRCENAANAVKSNFYYRAEIALPSGFSRRALRILLKVLVSSSESR